MNLGQARATISHSAFCGLSRGHLGELVTELAWRWGARCESGPEGYEPALTAFEQANKAALEQFPGYLAAKLREIRLVEYTFSNNPVTCDGRGPRASMPVGQRMSDIREWEHGEATPVVARLGPAGLETLDTLIMAGIAATRAEAIRWALDRIRERPAYQRLRELRCDAGKLKNEF